MFGRSAGMYSTFMMLRNMSEGGPRWEVLRRVGDGQSGRPQEGVVGVVTGFAFQSAPRNVAVTGQGFVPQTTWRFLAEPHSDLRKGDRLRSVRAPGLKFQVMSLDPEVGHIQATIEVSP